MCVCVCEREGGQLNQWWWALISTGGGGGDSNYFSEVRGEFGRGGSWGGGHSPPLHLLFGADLGLRGVLRRLTSFLYEFSQAFQASERPCLCTLQPTTVSILKL